MAITSTGSLGSIANGVLSSSTTLITTAALAAGAIGFVVVAIDNAATVDGNTNTIAEVVDSVGNIWVKAYEYTNSNGVAGDGSTVGLFWVKALATLPLGGTIKAWFNSTINNSCMSAWAFAVAAGNSFIRDTFVTAADDAIDPSSIVIGGLSSVERLYLRGIAGETTSATVLTPTAGFTAITETQTGGTGQAVRGEFRINTSTGETSDPTWIAVDQASVFLAFSEAAGGSLFTNIRAESRDPAVVTLRWAYTGQAAVSVLRAVHGGSFSKIITFPGDYPSSSVTSFIDDSVTEQVYYDYKLSDDNGATFTSIVSVVAQKKFPEASVGAARNNRRVNLPNFTTPEDVTPDSVQQMADELQAFLNGETVAAPRPCQVCPVNGALTLDCSTGCYRFIVSEADAVDVNSISVNCESLELDFRVPKDITLEVCGFPETSGFTGDECLQAPINQGVTGFTVIDKQDVDCGHVRIRIPLPTCADYTKDCYDDGSLFWTGGTKFNMAHPTCRGGTSPSACCGGNQIYTQSGSISANVAAVLSGDLNIGGGPGAMAGYTLLFGRSGDPLAAGPWGTELQYRVNTTKAGAPLKGKPIFGCATNVPSTATVTKFTGLVLLLDYSINQITLGQYTDANLRLSPIPTPIATGALPADVGWIFMSNAPSLASGLFQVWATNGVTVVFSHADAGHTGPAGNIGSGFIWVGNGGFGQHIGEINFNSAQTYVSYNGI